MRRDRCEEDDERTESGVALKFVHSEFGEPFVSDPGVTGASVGKRIGVGNRFVLGNELAGFEVPPDVGVDDIARSHGEEPKEEDGEEGAFRGEGRGHDFMKRPWLHPGWIENGRARRPAWADRER